MLDEIERPLSRASADARCEMEILVICASVDWFGVVIQTAKRLLSAAFP